MKRQFEVKIEDSLDKGISDIFDAEASPPPALIAAEQIEYMIVAN